MICYFECLAGFSISKRKRRINFERVLFNNGDFCFILRLFHVILSLLGSSKTMVGKPERKKRLYFFAF